MDIQEKIVQLNLDNTETFLPKDTQSRASKKLHSNNKVLKCRDKELEIGKRTYIMGVLNLTPDSFYDGGKYSALDKALKHTEQMIDEGADIIDIGGESTRPGSLPVSVEQECNRVILAIKEINNSFDTIISIDTTKSEVAYEALKEGASMVNDISGLKFDEKLAGVVKEFNAAVVLSHTSSRPEDMQQHTDYESLIEDILESLNNSVTSAESKGINQESIVVDPGFGFGKTQAQNLYLLKNLNRFSELGKPILIGTSNKSFIGKALNASIGDRVEGTAATVAIGIMNGASIVRVHDIEYMKKVSIMTDAVAKVKFEDIG